VFSLRIKSSIEIVVASIVFSLVIMCKGIGMLIGIVGLYNPLLTLGNMGFSPGMLT